MFPFHHIDLCKLSICKMGGNIRKLNIWQGYWIINLQGYWIIIDLPDPTAASIRNRRIWKNRLKFERWPKIKSDSLWWTKTEVILNNILKVNQKSLTGCKPLHFKTTITRFMALSNDLWSFSAVQTPIHLRTPRFPRSYKLTI